MKRVHRKAPVAAVMKETVGEENISVVVEVAIAIYSIGLLLKERETMKEEKSQKRQMVG